MYDHMNLLENKFDNRTLSIIEAIFQQMSDSPKRLDVLFNDIKQHYIEDLSLGEFNTIIRLLEHDNSIFFPNTYSICVM